MSPRPPKDASKERARFIQFLEARKLRLTPHRAAVFDTLFAEHRHFEAEELFAQLQANKHRASRATVYRTLELLQECQLVTRLDFGTPHVYYERVELKAHHDHLFCQKCGKVIEFHSPELEALQDAICQRHGFSQTHHSLRIFGACRECRALKT